MDSHYDIFKLISPREDAEMSQENGDLVSAPLAIRRATGYGGTDEGQPHGGPVDVILLKDSTEDCFVIDVEVKQIRPH